MSHRSRLGPPAPRWQEICHRHWHKFNINMPQRYRRAPFGCHHSSSDDSLQFFALLAAPKADYRRAEPPDRPPFFVWLYVNIIFTSVGIPQWSNGPVAPWSPSAGLRMQGQMGRRSSKNSGRPWKASSRRREDHPCSIALLLIRHARTMNRPDVDSSAPPCWHESCNLFSRQR